MKLNGLAKRAHKRISDFNPRSLEKGIEIEMEHTRNRATAKRIAMDHLTEDRRYYQKLEQIEGKMHKPKRKRTKKNLRAAIMRLRRKLCIKGSNENLLKLHKLEHDYINF